MIKQFRSGFEGTNITIINLFQYIILLKLKEIRFEKRKSN